MTVSPYPYDTGNAEFKAFLDALTRQANTGLATTVIDTPSKLPDPVGDKITLTPGLNLLQGTVNIGSDYLEVPAGCYLRGLTDAVIVSTNTGGVVQTDSPASNIVMREFTVVAPAGPAFNLVGDIAYQLNLFFVASIAAQGGIVDGWDVQALKSIFHQGADGWTFGGTCNKVFVGESVFYDVTAGNAGITLAADLVTDVVDLGINFFKHDAGAAIKAETGYTVRSGFATRNLITGTATPLEGLSKADPNWQMSDNSGISDSRTSIAAWDATVRAVTITTPDTYVDVWPSWTTGTVVERFRVNDSTNAIEYFGKEPATVKLTYSVTVDPANQQEVGIGIALNGTLQPESEVLVVAATGASAFPRTVTGSALLQLSEFDEITVQLKNVDDTTNITIDRVALTID